MRLRRETLSRGVTEMYAQLVFAVVLERLFFGVISFLLSVLGAAVIMSSSLCHHEKKKTEASSRQCR
ncbi:uncharacterized protein EDB93DRAFT_1195115 [Suillus bovinus]|uniref:uncharacterized protein n=1 Tax=Suillus bovinus TaxID=48563 RepID=UPI001B85E642|nr:uncharacterized protein EDB93DRAFT_1195115 [Suillus bovinus]KAG2123783.1 hypothetical protein EDB93DRAFT_1195115 [Suillus bovinus]